MRLADLGSQGEYSASTSSGQTARLSSTLALESWDLHGLEIELGESSKLVHYGEQAPE